MLSIMLAMTTLLKLSSITGLSVQSSVTTWDDGPQTKSFYISLRPSAGARGIVFAAQDGQVVSVTAVGALVNALSHVEELPTFAGLRIPPDQALRLTRSVATACKSELSESLILGRYFSQRIIRADDYPDETVTIETSSGEIKLRSTAQHLYGLPWFVSGLWSNLADYDSAVSLAIAEISGPKDPNQSRLLNAPFWDEQFDNYLPSLVCGSPYAK